MVVAESTIRRVTLGHAQKIHRRSQGFPQGLPAGVAPGQTFIAEIDGTMVPTVRADAAQADQRKGKTVQWQECKVSLAHADESRELFYGARCWAMSMWRASGCARAPSEPGSAKATACMGWATARPGSRARCNNALAAKQAESVRVFRTCPLVTPKDTRSSLQMLAIARAMAALCA